MFATVNTKKFPRGISDQVISLTNRVLLNRVLAFTWSGTLDQVISSRNAATVAGRRAPDPGIKIQATGVKL
jgi:hypothetical protein